MSKALPVFLLLLLASAPAFGRVAACESEACGLVIRGEVTGLEVEKEKGYVKFHVRLNVEFTNEGAAPIILFAPTFGETYGPDRSGYWLGGWALYKTSEEAKDGRPIFVDGVWQSVMGSESYRQRAEKLDAPTPPPELTRILAPGESWGTTDRLRISFEADKHHRYPELRTWAEMQEFLPQLWLTVSYELSPWNVEYFKPDLIRKLKKRWAAFGNVLVEEKKEGRFNLFRMSSEPMLIDFSRATEREPEPQPGQ